MYHAARVDLELQVTTKDHSLAHSAGNMVRLLLATATHTAHPVPQATLQLTASHA